MCVFMYEARRIWMGIVDGLQHGIATFHRRESVAGRRVTVVAVIVQPIAHQTCTVCRNRCFMGPRV